MVWLFENQRDICLADDAAGQMMIIEWTTAVESLWNTVLTKKFNLLLHEA